VTPRRATSEESRTDRAANRVLRWCDCYTRDVDPERATQRRSEIISDLHEHREWATDAGVTDADVARQIRRRHFAGLWDDLSWRRTELRARAASDPRFAKDRAIEISAVSLVAALAALTLSWGLLVIVRVALSVGHWAGPSGEVYDAAIETSVSTAIAVIGLLLLIRWRTRWMGAAVLAVALYGVMHFGLVAMNYASTTMGWLQFMVPGWQLITDGVAVGSAALLMAVAVWWMPEEAR
jgi:hypothetical protein